jgi:hypothetical protein
MHAESRHDKLPLGRGVMHTIQHKIAACLFGSVLAAMGANAALAAACKAGDLAGDWSKYASVLTPNVAYMLRCSVTLTNSSASPIRYSIAGTCRGNSASAQTSLEVSGTDSLIETGMCKLRGSFTMQNTGDPSSARNVVILDARIEDNKSLTMKNHIVGVSRANEGGGQSQIFNFSFSR